MEFDEIEKLRPIVKVIKDCGYEIEYLEVGEGLVWLRLSKKDNGSSGAVGISAELIRQ